MVAGGGGAPVLSSGGAGGCRESGSLERAFPALSRGDPHQGVQQYPEPARTGQRSTKPPYIYRCIQGL